MGSIWVVGLTAKEIAFVKANGGLTSKVYRAILHNRKFARPSRERRVVDPSPRATAQGGLNGHAVESAFLIEGVALSNLRYDHCRWPIGDPLSPDFHYCGEQKGEKSRYCDRHHAIAYRPVEPIELEE